MISAITDTDIFTSVRTYILGLVDCKVVKAQSNRVPMPSGEFVAMTPTAISPLETNRHVQTMTEQTIETPSKMTIQIDCYGSLSHGRAQAIAAMFRDEYACDVFAATGFDLQPLFATDPQQMPIINGEAQYEQRWTFSLELQVNHAITITSETAGMLALGTAPVDQAIGTVFIAGDGINIIN